MAKFLGGKIIQSNEVCPQGVQTLWKFPDKYKNFCKFAEIGVFDFDTNWNTLITLAKTVDWIAINFTGGIEMEFKDLALQIHNDQEIPDVEFPNIHTVSTLVNPNRMIETPVGELQVKESAQHTLICKLETNEQILYFNDWLKEMTNGQIRLKSAIVRDFILVKKVSNTKLRLLGCLPVELNYDDNELTMSYDFFEPVTT